MFIASAFDEDQTLLILGLSVENVRRLEAGLAIQLTRESHGVVMPANLKIIIFAGETEETMRAQMESLLGPATVIGQKKPQ